MSDPIPRSGGAIDPVKAAAESRGQVAPPAAPEPAPAPAPAPGGGGGGAYPGLGVRFNFGNSLRRASEVRPYERSGTDPLYRSLKIYTTDPAESPLDGSRVVLAVPYEPLTPGPVGSLLAVVDRDDTGDVYRPIDLDDPRHLLGNGRDPSPSDPQSHQQMAYAVCMAVYSSFRKALGRQLHWGFDRKVPRPDAPSRLVIRPHAADEENAYYSKADGEIRFGYYRARDEVAGRNLPGGYVFTCLSHDVIAHEFSHALLDGLRPHFVHPSNADVLAFHEAFADLVAIFQRFSYSDLVRVSMGRARGRIEQAALLTDLARQFGHTTGRNQALRTAIDAVTGEGDLGGAGDAPPGGRRPAVYDPGLEPHAMGSVLVSAVFDAFLTVFRRKTKKYYRLATGGTGVLPAGELPDPLLDILAAEASKTAAQFQTICIRAIDYCPPMDVTFGDYLRAIITADRDLVPDDPWGYRDAIVDAFRRRRIYPTDVPNLAEDALLWRPPARAVRRVDALSFANARFRGDPGAAPPKDELERQAYALALLVTDPANSDLFGVVAAGDPRLNGDQVEPPRVESVRSVRRVGPDGQIVFDLVAEVAQRRWARQANGPDADFFGGSTILFGPDGNIRLIVLKNVLSEPRLQRQVGYMKGAGREYWVTNPSGTRLVRSPTSFRSLHDNARKAHSRRGHHEGRDSE